MVNIMHEQLAVSSAPKFVRPIRIFSFDLFILGKLQHRQRSTSTAVCPEDVCVEDFCRLSLQEGCIERHIFVSDLPLELILYILSLLPCRSAIKLVLSHRTLYNTFFLRGELLQKSM